MSRKVFDRSGRWRNHIVAFRMSPEENEELDARVALSGLTKQEYLIRRCMERDVVVVGNPRVHKALKEQMKRIYEELQRLDTGKNASVEFLETVQMALEIHSAMANDNH